MYEHQKILNKIERLVDQLPYRSVKIEVELKEGSDAAAIAFADALAAKYGLQAEPRSKYRRALTLAQS